MQFKSKCLIGLPWWYRVESPPSNAGDVGLIPGRGTKIPCALGQLSLSAATREAQHATAQSLHAATKTRSSQKKKKRRQKVFLKSKCFITF